MRRSPPVSERGSVRAASIRVGDVDGEPAVTLAAGQLEATFLPGLGLLGASLRHRGEELLALPGGVAGYRAGSVERRERSVVQMPRADRIIDGTPSG